MYLKTAKRIGLMLSVLITHHEQEWIISESWPGWKETSGGTGQAHGMDWGDSFMSVCLSPKKSYYTH